MIHCNRQGRRTFYKQADLIPLYKTVSCSFGSLWTLDIQHATGLQMDVQRSRGGRMTIGVYQFTVSLLLTFFWMQRCAHPFLKIAYCYKYYLHIRTYVYLGLLRWCGASAAICYQSFLRDSTIDLHSLIQNIEPRHLGILGSEDP